ncbi:hypothetical protein ACILPN_07590 [Yersinia wautersii]|nr:MULTISPECIES: hypothetical protein [Yersinia]MDN0122337.1 hypothetical protein [Yersinia aleksiciae]MDR4898239.1 hypothetical protein [Yersinia kristensenii]MDX6734412.1 hypothetical protein [Yersinia kristensenii]
METILKVRRLSLKQGLSQRAIPLLINPCDHDPDDHLIWHINNLKIPILLAKSVDNLPDEKGVKSIEVMGLNRFGLVTVRAEVLQPVAVKVGSISELIDITASMSSCEARDRCLAKIGRDIDALQACYEPDREYAAMVKSCIDSHMENLKRDLAGLLA